MGRPKRLRRLTHLSPVHSFLPAGERSRMRRAEPIILTMDELESLRLADLECLSQERAARRMGISRATFGRIVERGRSKVAGALVHGLPLEISGGAFMFGHGRHLQCPRCRHRQMRNSREAENVECRRCCQPLLRSENQRESQTT
jgi:predicted DNA-binding protein (UPF0251 family)